MNMYEVQMKASVFVLRDFCIWATNQKTGKCGRCFVLASWAPCGGDLKSSRWEEQTQMTDTAASMSLKGLKKKGGGG